MDKLEVAGQVKQLADSIHRHGLSSMVILLLDMHKPLFGVLSAFSILGLPILVPFLGLNSFQVINKLLEDPSNFETLLLELEIRLHRGAS